MYPVKLDFPIYFSEPLQSAFFYIGWDELFLGVVQSRTVLLQVAPSSQGHMMSLPFYQKSHQHYDLSYRNKDLRTTMSHYQQEKKRSAIYTHGSTAYSSRSSAAHRQESEAFSQVSAVSSQQQAAQAYSLGASQFSRGTDISRKTASAYDYGYSHG